MASNFGNRRVSNSYDNPNPSPLLKRKESARGQTESFHLKRISNMAPGPWLSRRISNIYENPDPSGAPGALNERSTKCYKIAIAILAILLLLSSTLAALFAFRTISLPALLNIDAQPFTCTKSDNNTFTVKLDTIKQILINKPSHIFR